MSKPECNHFIVKHGLDAFRLLPNYIWRTDKGPKDVPPGFNKIKRGDRWIAFAYTTSDYHERPLSLITGFFECTQEKYYGDIPLPPEKLEEGIQNAWMIEGKPFGEQPRQPVGVRPIDDLLSRRTFKQTTFVPITSRESENIRTETLSLQFDTKRIPLLHREPENEQELLSTVVYGHKALGIEKIVRVRKAFPDLLVEIEGNPGEVHLELELYSSGFFSHGHDKDVVDRAYKEDGRPIAVLCWIDNSAKVKDQVHRVYELQSLIREGKKITW
jgi:hypothetical protein